MATVTTISTALWEKPMQQLPYRWASLQREMQSSTTLPIACDRKQFLLVNPILKCHNENITPSFRRSRWSRPIATAINLLQLLQRFSKTGSSVTKRCYILFIWDEKYIRSDIILLKLKEEVFSMLNHCQGIRWNYELHILGMFSCTFFEWTLLSMGQFPACCHVVAVDV